MRFSEKRKAVFGSLKRIKKNQFPPEQMSDKSRVLMKY